MTAKQEGRMEGGAAGQPAYLDFYFHPSPNRSDQVLHSTHGKINPQTGCKYPPIIQSPASRNLCWSSLDHSGSLLITLVQFRSVWITPDQSGFALDQSGSLRITLDQSGFTLDHSGSLRISLALFWITLDQAASLWSSLDHSI